MKKCSKCKTNKPYSEFNKSLKYKDGLYSSCKGCRSEYRSKLKARSKSIMIPDTKHCCRCNNTKNNKDFNRRSYSLDGLSSICKICSRKDKSISRAGSLTEPKIHVKSKKCCHCKSTQPIDSFCKDKYSRDEHSPMCRKCNTIACRKYNASLDKQTKKARREKYFRNHPQAKIANNIRNRLNKIIKNKPTSFINALGCTIVHLIKFLEDQFEPGMSWENHGEWHIDHIIPLSSFDLSDMEQYRRACHYTNLQPLWAADNIRKRNKIIDKTP